MTLQIFAAKVSESDPPKTVKSCEKTKTAPAVDPPVARDDAVSGNTLPVHPEVVAAVDDEGVELFERARIEERLDPLARR